jgi:hypothetical protein
MLEWFLQIVICSNDPALNSNHGTRVAFTTSAYADAVAEASTVGLSRMVVINHKSQMAILLDLCSTSFKNR